MSAAAAPDDAGRSGAAVGEYAALCCQGNHKDASQREQAGGDNERQDARHCLGFVSPRIVLRWIDGVKADRNASTHGHRLPSAAAHLDVARVAPALNDELVTEKSV